MRVVADVIECTDEAVSVYSILGRIGAKVKILTVSSSLYETAVVVISTPRGDIEISVSCYWEVPVDKVKIIKVALS